MCYLLENRSSSVIFIYNKFYEVIINLLETAIIHCTFPVNESSMDDDATE